MQNEITCQLVDFTIPADYSEKIKERQKKKKKKKTDAVEKNPKNQEKRLFEEKIWGRIETIQTTELLYLAGIFTEMQPIDMIIRIASSHLSSESLKTIILLQKGQTRWKKQKLIDFIL